MKNLAPWQAALMASLGMALFGCTQAPKLASRGQGTGAAVQPQVALGRVYERQGEIEKARQLYEAALKRDGSQAEAYHRLGVVADRQGQHDQAEAYYKQALDLAPQNADLWNDLGYSYYLQGRLEEAQQALELALERDPRHARAANNLGLVLGRQGKLAESMASFRQAGTEAAACANLAFVHAMRGEHHKARELYNRAVTLDNTLRPATEALVQLSRRGLEEPAIESASTAEGIAPAEPAEPGMSAVEHAVLEEPEQEDTQGVEQISFEAEPAPGVVVLSAEDSEDSAAERE